MLRGKPRYYKSAKESMERAVRQLDQLKAKAVTPSEHKAIKDVKETLLLYLKKLEVAKQNGRVRTLPLDKIVKVDDTSAIAGLHAVLEKYHNNIRKLRREDIGRSLVILVSMALLLGMLFYAFLKMDQSNRQLFATNDALHLTNETLEETNRSLNERNEELTQFAYRTSHDLKGPLIRSRRLSEYITKDLEAGRYEEATACSHTVQEQMRRLEQVVTDLLALTKAELEASEQEAIHFEELLTEIKSRLTWLREDARCQLIEEINIKEPVKSERTRLSQILENLLSNAFKYQDESEDAPFVRLSIFDTPEHLELHVEDNGVGIPIEKHEEVFQMFIGVTQLSHEMV